MAWSKRVLDELETGLADVVDDAVLLEVAVDGDLVGGGERRGDGAVLVQVAAEELGGLSAAQVGPEGAVGACGALAEAACLR